MDSSAKGTRGLRTAYARIHSVTHITVRHRHRCDLCIMNRTALYILFIALGAAAGWAYWNWYGCINGCAITGRWWTSTGYGAVLGYLVLGMLLPTPQKSKAAGE